VDIVNDMGYANSNLGVIGIRANVEGLNKFINEGLINYATYTTIRGGLPEANFTDISYDYAKLIMVKGDEEIANFKKAALMGEKLHEYLVENTKVGIDVNA